MSEPIGAFAIRVSLLDDEPLTPYGRRQLEAMRVDAKRMTDALARISARFQLEVGECTSLARHRVVGRARLDRMLPTHNPDTTRR